MAGACLCVFLRVHWVLILIINIVRGDSTKWNVYYLVVVVGRWQAQIFLNFCSFFFPKENIWHLDSVSAMSWPYDPTYPVDGLPRFPVSHHKSLQCALTCRKREVVRTRWYHSGGFLLLILLSLMKTENHQILGDLHRRLVWKRILLVKCLVEWLYHLRLWESFTATRDNRTAKIELIKLVVINLQRKGETYYVSGQVPFMSFCLGVWGSIVGKTWTRARSISVRHRCGYHSWVARAPIQAGKQNSPTEMKLVQSW